MQVKVKFSENANGAYVFYPGVMWHIDEEAMQAFGIDRPGIYEINRVEDLPKKVRPIYFPERQDLDIEDFWVCECGHGEESMQDTCPCCGAEWGEPIEAAEVQKLLEERDK